MRFLKQSTAVTIVIGPLMDWANGKTRLTDNDDFDQATDLQCELVKGSTSSTLTLTKTGGSNDINLTGKGLATLELTASDVNTLGMLRLCLSDKDISSYPSETILPVTEDFMVMPANVYDSMFGSDILSVDAGSSNVIPTGYVGDYLEDGIVYILWRTTATQTENGVIKVYRNDNPDEVTMATGITDTRNFDGSTNVHLCSIDLSANTFYGKQTDFSVVLAGATIDGNSVNAVIATFSVENRYSGKTYIRQG